MADLDQYYTHPGLARKTVEWSGARAGMRILEPSAGCGAFVRHLPAGSECLAIDVDAGNLEATATCERVCSLATLQLDFLQLAWGDRKPFDLAIMNPPYGSRGADVPPGADSLHVAHALSMCDRVVALVKSTFFYTARRYKRVWNHCCLTKVAHLVDRPRFTGPSDRGFTPRADFCVVELARSTLRNTGEADTCTVEFWREKDWT